MESTLKKNVVVKKRLVIKKALVIEETAPVVAQAQTPAVAQSQENPERYISQLTPQEKIVFKIAQEHLETSFDLERSIGYNQWLKAQKL